MRKLGLFAATPIVAILAGAVWAQPAATDKEVDDALNAFHKAYASKDESARLEAVEQLGAVQHKRVVDALAGPLAKDSVPAVRRAAAKALGAQWSPTAVTALGKALNPDDTTAPDVNAAIVEALGQTNADAAVPILTSLLVPKRQQGRRGGQQGGGEEGGAGAENDPASLTLPALEALKKIASPKAMDDVLDFLGKQGTGGRGGRGGRGGGGGGGGQQRDPLASQAELVLEAITGQHQNGILAWRKWWTDNSGHVKVFTLYRCQTTGEVWEKTTPTTKCPQDGDKNAHCSVALKTRLDGGGKAPAEHEKKSHDKPKKDPSE
jgi:hypothetical protein